MNNIDKSEDKVQSNDDVRVHNDKVRNEVIKVIKGLLTVSYERLCVEGDPTHIYIQRHHLLYKIAKDVCGYGWTETCISDVFLDALVALQQANNWWLYESYNALVHKGLANKLDPYFIGYDTIK
jgi:hypothetical protein